MEFIPYKWACEMDPDIVKKANRIAESIERERATGKEIFPPTGSLYKTLSLTSPDEVSVVILGQDPYPTPGNAMGLAFSVQDGQPVPASLKNIYKEMHDDLGVDVPNTGDLTPWAKSGVLLLNTVLSVESGKPESHKKLGWQVVTRDIIRVCLEQPQPIVFLLWGRHANALLPEEEINRYTQKYAVRASHPSPLGCRKGNSEIPAFLGSKPFSKANELLDKNIPWGSVNDGE